MGRYLPGQDIIAARGNIAVNADGSVWANYLLRGAQMIPSNPDSVRTGQAENKSLFDRLSRMPTTDAYLGGLKVRVSPEESVRRMIDGVHSASGGEVPPDLISRCQGVANEMRFGRYKEYRRIYFLSLRIPRSITSAAQELIKAGKVDPLHELDWEEMHRYQEEHFRSQIPRAFWRSEEELMARPAHLNWIAERIRLRGLDVPELPSPAEDLDKFNPNAFRPVMVNKIADSQPVFDEFIERTAKGYTGKPLKTRVRQYMKNYRSAMMSGHLAVYSPEERDDALPDGAPSRQAFLAVTGYPKTPKVVLNTFTSMVDRVPGLDADFVMRMHFDQTDISVSQQRQFEGVVQSESQERSSDRIDEDEFAQRLNERRSLAARVKGSTAPRSIAVTTMFALAHPNEKTLREYKQNFIDKLTEENFSVLGLVGGQYHLLEQMAPCVPTSKIVNDLKGVTTVEKFAACMPVRRTEAGDPIGIPFAVNKENSLGQIIFRDFLGSTNNGSGSILLTGAQGSGKSYELKTMIDWFCALKRPMTIFDQSSAQEYMTFAAAQTAVHAIDVANPNVSFDPLKVFAHDPNYAQEMIIELFQILQGWAVDSPQMMLLNDILKPGWRTSKVVSSMRDLRDALLRDGNLQTRPGYEALSAAFRFWSDQHYTRGLFDPVDQGGNLMTRLPAYRLRQSSDTYSVVYLTAGLPLHQGDLTANTDAKVRYGTAMYTLLGRLTKMDLGSIQGLTPMVGDELAFWKQSDVLQDIVNETDKTGRKQQNIFVGAAQLPEHVDGPAYNLIRCKVALRQETENNARAGLQWVGMPPTPAQLKKMLTDTSPADPEDPTRPMKDREGEGWYNDGWGNVVRAQMIPMFNSAAAVMADTTSSRMVRADQLTDAQRAAAMGQVPG